MTQKLSHSFYGNKKFKKNHHEAYIAHKTISDQQVKDIFKPYSEYLQTIASEDGTTTLLSIFSEFIRENLRKFRKFPFEKLTTWIEMSAHIFQYSFEHHLNKKQSFEYFTQVTVRHSLFRPPHSVCIFSYDELKEIMEYWIDTFNRFYDEYAQCFMTDENKILAVNMSGFSFDEKQMKKGKPVDREELSKMFDFVNSKPEEPKEESS